MSNLEKKNETRDTLKKLSQQVKPLVDQGQFNTVNEALIEIMYRQYGEKYQKFTDWKAQGYTILKGSKGFPVWAQPLKITRKKEESEQDEEGEYFPICYLFNENQVRKLD